MKRYYVYCLKSLKSPKFHYFGFTSNLEQRMKYHLSGKVRTTNRYKPVRLFGYKVFEQRQAAIDFEKELKRSYSLRKRFLEEIRGN